MSGEMRDSQLDNWKERLAVPGSDNGLRTVSVFIHRVLHNTIQMNERFWSTLDAARLTGLSVDMLNYLQRSGILASKTAASQRKVRGKPRAYTFADLLILKAIGSLTAAGVSVLRLRKSINAARNMKLGTNDGGSAGRYLVTTGNVARIVAEDDLSRLLPSLGTTLVVIDIEQLRRALMSKLHEAEPSA